MPSLAPWSAHSADAADTRLSQQAAVSGVAPPSDAPYLFLVLCLIRGLSPGWCPKHTPQEGREPVCWGEEVPPPFRLKETSPPHQEAHLLLPRPRRSRQKPWAQPRDVPVQRCSHPSSRRPVAVSVFRACLHPPTSITGPCLLTPPRGAVRLVCRVQTEPRSPLHPRVGSDRPGLNDALNPRPGALEGRGPLPLSSDSLPHLTLRGPDASL